jgi:hypothetical protein
MQSERSLEPITTEPMKLSMDVEHDGCCASKEENFVYLTATLTCTISSNNCPVHIKVCLDHHIDWDGLYNNNTCTTQCGNSNTMIKKGMDGFYFHFDDEHSSFDATFTVPLELFLPEIKKVIELRDQHQLDYEKSYCSTCGELVSSW